MNNIEFNKNSVLKDVFIKICKNNKVDEMYDFIKNIKIIDPTCGSGAFLFATFKIKVWMLKRINNSKKSLEYIYIDSISNIFGIDISKEAVTIFKIRLLLFLIWENLNAITFNKIINNNFIVYDMVIENNKWGALSNLKFDLVVGNPPYIEKRNYNGQIGNFESLKCNNLFSYILEKSILMLSAEGISERH